MENSLPDNAFGGMARQGQTLFVKTRENAPHLVDSQLSCVNCHLKRGRRTSPAPQRTAYPVYPVFRARNNKVDTLVERLQSCLQFSMNGKVPTANSPEIKTLTAYAY